MNNDKAEDTDPEQTDDADQVDESEWLLGDDVNFDDIDACVDWWLAREERGHFREEQQAQMLHVQKDLKEFLRRLQLARQERATSRIRRE